jgi:hypothetical protein
VSEPLRINPSAIAIIAAQVGRTATDLIGETTVLANALGPDPGPAGWPATDALRAALDATVAHLVSLGYDLRGAGDALASAVATVQATDQRAADRFRAVAW